VCMCMHMCHFDKCFDLEVGQHKCIAWRVNSFFLKGVQQKETEHRSYGYESTLTGLFFVIDEIE